MLPFDLSAVARCAAGSYRRDLMLVAMRLRAVPSLMVHAALMLLLALLRQRDVISDLPSPTGRIADELARYDAHMRDARGLSAGTRRSQLRIVQRLLLAKFTGRPFRFERLAPEDVRRFIAEQLELRNTTSNALAINAALRGICAGAAAAAMRYVLYWA